MKKLILVLLLLTGSLCYSQRDTTITDSTPLLGVKHVDYLLFQVKERIREKVTVKEFDDLVQVFNTVINQCAADYQRRKRRK